HALGQSLPVIIALLSLLQDKYIECHSPGRYGVQGEQERENLSFEFCQSQHQISDWSVPSLRGRNVLPSRHLLCATPQSSREKAWQAALHSDALMPRHTCTIVSYSPQAHQEYRYRRASCQS